MPIEAREVQCPYCGETTEIDVEPLDENQSFIEDCTVCCRPIQYNVTASDEGVEVSAQRSE